MKPTALPSPVRAIVLASLAAALAAFSASASAAPLFKPGLWEISNTPGSGAGGAQVQGLLALAQQQMQNMDPAQRARIEGMMAQNGVVIDNGSLSAKACITPAMAARQQMPVQQKGDCSYRYEAASGNSLRYSFSCSKPQARGEGTAVFSDAANYTATTRVSSGEHSLSIDSRGRWLGRDCGSVAPADGS